MTPDFITISGVRYRIIDRAPVRYLYSESDAERKARWNGAVPYVEFVVGTLGRVRDE